MVATPDSIVNFLKLQPNIVATRHGTTGETRTLGQILDSLRQSIVVYGYQKSSVREKRGLPKRHRGGKMAGRLQDKVAIITGAGTGIGKAISMAYAKEGAHIVAAARRLEKLEETAEKVRNLFGVKAVAKRCDVTIKDDCQNLAAEVIKEFGKIDILVNNAAYFPVRRFLAITPEEWDAVLATNLKGCVLMCQAVLPYMVDQKSGKIVMVGSSQARLSVYGQIHYACSKAGVIALTRCLAAEFGRKGIRVNGFLCGFTPETEGATQAGEEAIVKKFGADVSDELKAQLLAKANQDNAADALGRVGHIEDYQGIAVLLASDESDFITGQTISVDGGSTMP
jgi:NAD(P)-dependent dehydrogenase (short-subunit alcohol dehydrogenase family)